MSVKIISKMYVGSVTLAKALSDKPELNEATENVSCQGTEQENQNPKLIFLNFTG